MRSFHMPALVMVLLFGGTTGAIALPSYYTHLQQENRLQAMHSLRLIDDWLAQNQTAPANNHARLLRHCAQVLTKPAPGYRYHCEPATEDKRGYLLTATALPPQQGSYQLDSTGKQTTFWPDRKRKSCWTVSPTQPCPPERADS